MTQTLTTEPEAPSGRHPVNIGHLVMGLAFVGLFGVWALIQGDVVDGSDIRWLLPVPWVLAGIAGLLATTLTGRDHWATRQSDWATRQTGWVPPGTATATAPTAEPATEPAEPADTGHATETTSSHRTDPTDPTDPTEEIR